MRQVGRYVFGLMALALLAACSGNSTPAATPTPVVPTYTAYVLNVGDGTIVAIPLATGVAGTPMQVGGSFKVFGLAIPKDGKMAYIAGAGNLAVVRLATGQVRTPIVIQPGISGPIDVAVTPDGKWAYTLDYNASAITPVNLATGQVGTPIGVADKPYSAAMAPDGKTVYALAGGAAGNPNVQGEIFPIDTTSNQAQATIKLPGGLSSIGFAPDGKTLYAGYVTNDAAGKAGAYLASIDLASGKVTTLWQSTYLINAIAITPDGKTAWLAYQFSYGTAAPSHLVTLDLASLTASAPIIVGTNDSQPHSIVIARSN